jgi:POT family proton-dependent oligopeptide transporter
MGQPRGLVTLSMTEVWERFSYYGMRALLVLYLVAPVVQGSPPGPGLGFATSDAVAIYGCYTSLVYLTPIAGGWIADRLLGPRRSIVVGGSVIAAGHFIMIIPGSAWFWVGLLCVAVGTGLLKPSISATLGGLYTEGDPRRDGGFSLFYMGINIGAFLAPLVCGTLAVVAGWQVGFAAAGVGMLIGLAQYLLTQRSLGVTGVAVPKPATAHERRRAGLGLGGALACVGAILLVDKFTFGYDVTDLTEIMSITVIGIAVFYFWRIFRAPSLVGRDRHRVKAFLALFIGAAMFYAIFDQGGSTLSAFAEKFTDRQIGSFEMPTSWLQSINPIFIIIFAPMFAILWTRLANRAPSTPLKFAIALIGVGASFLLMVLPGLMADGGQKSSVWWLVGVYLLQTWAELLLSPTGLSATTKLAPAGMASQLLALWFVATAVGDSVGGQSERLQQGFGWAGYFAFMGALAVVMGLAFLLFVQRIRALMDDIH